MGKAGSNRYDVIIVGAGPAGIFSAIELVRNLPDLKVLIIERGKDIESRKCPLSANGDRCLSCTVCQVLSGWGGAGAFSDGKLNLSSEIGGFLTRYVDLETLRELIRYVDSIYLEYGAPQHLYGEDEQKIQNLKERAVRSELLLISSKLRHIGTDRCRVVLGNMWQELKDKITVMFESEVEEVITKNKKAIGVRLKGGSDIFADFIVLAPGRAYSRWLEMEARRLGLTLLKNPVDIGVRVETHAHVLEHLTKIVYEPKLVYYSKKFDDKVRTFCFNPYGVVVKEHFDRLWTVNGHSYSGIKTNNTNFAILVSTYFTEPFDEPISYGMYIAQLANFLGGGVIVQRLGDLKKGRRSTPDRILKGMVEPTLKDATPGDLSFVLPYRHLSNILEMLEALDNIAPGVNSRHTLLYGVEVKFYSMQLKLTSSLETEITNLFAIGDGAGVSRGLVHSSVSGVISARELLTRYKKQRKGSGSKL